MDHPKEIINLSLKLWFQCFVLAWYRYVPTSTRLRSPVRSQVFGHRSEDQRSSEWRCCIVPALRRMFVRVIVQWNYWKKQFSIILSVYIFAIQQSALSPEVRNIHGLQEHYVSAETVLHGMQVCNAVRITCQYSMHYIVSRPKNTLKLHDISVFASLVMQWYGTSKKTCDVMYAEATPWAFRREGQGKAGRLTRYTTHDKLPSCHAVGIHLGSIWDPLDSYIIILLLDDWMLPFSNDAGKTMGCFSNWWSAAIGRLLSGNTSNWIQNSCSRRGVGAEELLTRPRPRYSWAKQHAFVHSCCWMIRRTTWRTRDPQALCKVEKVASSF
jgi:hypothetical protein